MSYFKPGKCVDICEDGSFSSDLANPNFTLSTSFSALRTIKTCKLCPADCRTCKNNLGCLTCADSNKILDQQNQCANSCSLGYYNESKIC